MREPVENDFDRDEILDKIFSCLVFYGLEKTTTRAICEATGLKSSSLYYWFKNKDEAVLDATIHGLNTIVDDLFTSAYTYLSDLDGLFYKVPKTVLKYKQELRFIYQVATSPQYGNRLRDEASGLPLAYNSYAQVLADRLDVQYKTLRPLVQLYISAVTNYILWENEENAGIQFEGLYNSVKQVLKMSEDSKGKKNGNIGRTGKGY